MSADRIALSGRLRAELIDLERVADRAVHLLARAKARNDADYLDGVALNLHGFYAGTEHLFEEIARELDRSVPSGPEWHRDLLLQMAAELPAKKHIERCGGENARCGHPSGSLMAKVAVSAVCKAVAGRICGCQERHT